jgi:hypothetical protein
VRKRIFFSYRRDDTGPAAGRVHDRLARMLRKDDLFFDVSTIGAGENFEARIDDAIARADAALIFIGDAWLGPPQASGTSRIRQADDYVRAEVRAALARPITTLPILVDGAAMPKKEQLPDDIRDLTTKNALPLRHQSFDDDTENIVAALLGIAPARRVWERKGRLWSRAAYAAGGAVAAAAALVVAALVHYWTMGRALEASIGAPATQFILIASAILGACIGLAIHARKPRR